MYILVNIWTPHCFIYCSLSFCLSVLSFLHPWAEHGICHMCEVWCCEARAASAMNDQSIITNGLLSRLCGAVLALFLAHVAFRLMVVLRLICLDSCFILAAACASDSLYRRCIIFFCVSRSALFAISQGLQRSSSSIYIPCISLELPASRCLWYVCLEGLTRHPSHSFFTLLRTFIPLTWDRHGAGCV